MSAAAGSLWNKNNWHWEEKNYNKLAVNLLTEILSNLQFKDGDVSVTLSDVKVKGEASISVRKGKQIIAFDLAFDCAYLATDSVNNSTGRLSCVSFSVEDAEDGDYEVRASTNETSSFSQTCRELVRVKMVKQCLKPRLKNFTADISKAESDAEKLAADARMRAEELAKAEEAAKCTGSVQQQILEEGKAVDAAKREQRLAAEKEKNVAASASAPVPVAVIGGGAGDGSVWNTNSYHWEEKTHTAWAKQRIVELIFKKFNPKSCNGEVTFVTSNAITSGEANTSIRKGKKIVIFDMGSSCGFTAEQYQADSKDKTVIGHCQGEVRISNFTSEDSPDEWQIVCKFDQSSEGAEIESFKKSLSKELVSFIRESLTSFVAELLKR